MQPLVFFGSDQYSRIVLQHLLSLTNFPLALVITDRPKPQDRNQKITPNPVEKLASTYHIKISYYSEKNETEKDLLEQIKTTNSKLAVAASFDHLLPPSVISLFPHGILNLHPSLLPQYRNVSPVQYALALGDTETGVSVFKISEEIDNGEIVAQATEAISQTDTNPTLSERLFHKGSELIIEYLETNQPKLVNKSFKKLFFTKRLTRNSGYLEWPVLENLLSPKNLPATETKNELLKLRLSHNPTGSILHDLVRALTPWPGVWTIIPTKKGELRTSLISVKPTIKVKVAGKPNPISWSDFEKYYLT